MQGSIKKIEEEIAILKESTKYIYVLSSRKNRYDSDFKIVNCFISLKKFHETAKDLLGSQTITESEITSLDIGEEIESSVYGENMYIRIQKFLLE